MSSLIYAVVETVTADGGPGWIADDLDRGHLDYFFWTMAAMCALNFVVYSWFARKYKLKTAFRKLFDAFFGNSEMRVVMLGLDAAGKTTILYKLHIGEVLSTVPTIGFNVEKVQYKNVMFTVWDVGGQEKLRPLWRHYFTNTDGLIYVVDSLDRERIGKARAEFQKGAMTPMEVCEGLGLYDLKNRIWHIQGSCALKGDGLYEGLDWLAGTLKELEASGRLPSGGTSLF
ncbi:hypothetical protein PR202_gb09466 [Eleusine coracana subsp. coracana]|uniref:ADP-ribosylation factor n=1 Tax=Eleusine coracana subsp. coracana TaxID=191504 RepID=A0AAV5EHG6_ELECO|nr:hypothetical protein PR202_gb09466 [Eleusine coracana subsp. coracana]